MLLNLLYYDAGKMQIISSIDFNLGIFKISSEQVK